MKTLAVCVLFGGIMASTAGGAEIGFIEAFALSDNRETVLQQLIPGTEDYYYYHSLHYQNTEQFDKVDQLLKAWIKQHNYTNRVREIQNRQALLTYSRSPQKSLDHIREQLNLKFDHQRENLDQPRALPTSLDRKLISRETLTKRAMQRYRNLKGFHDSALDWLATEQLNADQRRHLLERLRRPDIPNLADLVVKDLNYKNSGGFGSHSIHRQLLRSQLEECLQQQPNVRNDSNFVATYVSKLQPNDDVDWQTDPEEQAAYLDRLWEFVGTLAPASNSLKAHVLFHRLAFDQSQGIYNKRRFMEYIRLPRRLHYVRSEFLKTAESVRYPCDLTEGFGGITELPSIGNDEPIVRAYLAHFFVTEANYKPYEPFIDSNYLKHLFAETKIVNGLGDQERWYAMLPPELYQRLKERIDIAFESTNGQVFEVGEPVKLDLQIKNVETLIVKVYEVNAANYYRENGRDVNTDINLDGLVANEETTHEYSDPPLRRVRRHFEFPELRDPGVYVVDFIGNGKNSRAVVRIGRLRFTVETTPLGQSFRVYDEQNRHLPDALIWLAGREYKANDSGEIVVPFSNQPGRQQIVVMQGARCSLHSFQHESENYQLIAGMHVDRESLLKHNKATVLVRPSLRLNSGPVTLSRLKDVKLKLTSVDHDGVETTSEVAGFELYEDRESLHEFQVPSRISTIRFDLTAEIQVLSQGKPQTLAATQQFMLNQIDKTEHIEDLHFLKGDGGYRLELLGKTGESKAARPVSVELQHRDFTNPVKVSLQTDDHGVTFLGALEGIQAIRANSPGGSQHQWRLHRDSRTYRETLSGAVGEPILVPYLELSIDREDVSLLELRGGSFVADRSKAISLKDGFLVINGLGRGDYALHLKRIGKQIRIRVTEGPVKGGYVRGPLRQLEVRSKAPLQITNAAVDGELLTVSLANSSEFARVHVFALRHYPAFSAYQNLSVVRDRGASVMNFPAYRSLYQAGRNIGDEYEYILRRQYAQKFAGNMLTRPDVLLNPWAVRSTETSKQDAAEGDDFAPAADAPTASSLASRPGRAQAEVGHIDFANLDFLGAASTVLTNLTPDENGVIAIPRADLGPHQHLHILAVDPVSTVSKTLVVPESAVKRNDLRLMVGLDPAKHFTQQKQIKVLRRDETFELDDIGSAKFERYDNLASVYRLYTTISGDAKLAEFNFVMQWPKLDEQEKRQKYSKYACHELHFFLYKKDKPFFDAVVRPYLANKLDKTFVDQWLLEEDMEPYLDAWRFGQLNIVERVLLGQRIGGQGPRVKRHVEDLTALSPPDTTRRDHLFATAVRGFALTADDEFGFRSNSLAEKAKALSLSVEAFQAPAGAAVDDGLKRADKKMEERLEEAESDSRAALRQRKSSDRGRRYFRELGDADSASIRQLYRALDKTKEWAENNYYQLLIGDQNSQLVTASSFWQDYAGHDASRPFFSAHWTEASRNFTEMMFALSVLDLPFESPEHKVEFNEAKMKLTAGGPMVAFYQEVQPVTDVAENSPVLVSQNFYRDGDRYTLVDGQQRDKFVTAEFLVHTVYGCQIVVTNPTSTPQKLEVLLEVPVGAIPVRNAHYQRSAHLELAPYNTQTLEYHFYFPVAGEYEHFPVHVANENQLLASADPFKFNVVEKLSQFDKESWPYVSQFGSNDDVLDFLSNNNVQHIDLSKIAFRMKDKAFFQLSIETLKQRHAYNHVLWSYAIHHNLPAPASEFLQHADGFIGQCGSYLDSPLVSIDPVIRKTYEHLEYQPLVNARVHQLGDRRQILNDRFYAQYTRLMDVLTHRRELNDDDRLSVTYYMLLQDRIDNALHHYGKIRPERLDAHLQYEYLSAYLDCVDDDVQIAERVVAKYVDYPVDRWRKAFDAVRVLLDEVAGRGIGIADADDRNQVQTSLASTEPSFQFVIEAKEIRVEHQNIDAVRINYYLMDIELLFSRNPFVKQVSGRFSHIRPNLTANVSFQQNSGKAELDLPEQFHNRNVLVEITGRGIRKTQAYYAHSLNLQVTENYGQLRVSDGNSGRPLSTVYVKAYARMKDGSISFYKDGYTDIRGRFDYTSLSTNELDNVARFSLLILSESHGAIVTEVAPPKR